MADEPMIENEVEESKNDVVEDNDKTVSETRSRQQTGSRQQNQRPGRYGHQQSGQSEGYRRSHFQTRRKVCSFCVDKVKVIDWKNINSFRRYINNNGSIRARRKTGTCAKHQRQLAVAVKRARHLALSPFTDQHARSSKS